ncbi:transposase [Mesorhizobium sp. M0808]|uniref:transposase n=1 Tax=Mesorhizobium sp. M0808 TaxID=2957002 RepID=UPI0033359658
MQGLEMVGRKPRFSEEEKLSMLLRMQRGENVSRLADELGIHRQRLYSWREQLRVCGNLTPSRQGRPKKRPPEAPPDRQALEAGFALSAEQRRADGLTKARRRLSNLNARLGSNRLNFFFQEALRHVRGSQQQKDAPGGAASSKSFKK